MNLTAAWPTRRRRRSGGSSLEPNKRGRNKRGCKSKNCGKKQNLPNLREIDRICAKFAGNVRKFAQICEIVVANVTQLCAKFTAPFVAVPFVPI